MALLGEALLVATPAGPGDAQQEAGRYQRLVARRGKKQATLVVAHTILVIAYHLLQRGTTYADLGNRSFDERDRTAVEHRLVHRLQGLGYKVTLEPVMPAA